MLSKGFVESRLRLYLNPDDRYRTRLFSAPGKDCPIFSSLNISQILNFLDCLIPRFFLVICTFDYTIELYIDCIMVYDIAGEVLHEYRED